MGIITKIITVTKMVITALLGILQGLLKLLKEVLTLLVDIMGIIGPIAWVQKVVDTLRGWCNLLDTAIQWLKDKLLPE